MDVSVVESFEAPSSEKPFTESGECSDEVVLKFDDGNELFVSKNFLSYASPVFKAMFQEGFKECEEKKVNLKGKMYEDMLELLLCIHPSILKAVDRSNVLGVFPLTEEYQFTVIKGKCEDVLTKWLEELKSSIKTNPNVSSSTQYQRAETCLKILALVLVVEHDDLINKAVDVLSSCRSKAFAGLHFTTSYERTDVDPLKYRESCANLFGNLPDKMKVKVQFARLHICDA